MRWVNKTIHPSAPAPAPTQESHFRTQPYFRGTYCRLCQGEQPLPSASVRVKTCSAMKVSGSGLAANEEEKAAAANLDKKTNKQKNKAKKAADMWPMFKGENHKYAE